MNPRSRLWPVLGITLLALAACGPNPSYIVLVTATAGAGQSGLTPPASQDTPQPFGAPGIDPALVPTPSFVPTPEATRSGVASPSDEQVHVVQPGDTLAVIGARYGVSVEQIVARNNLPSADLISVGQSLVIPLSIQYQGLNFKVIPDSELIYGPGVRGFRVADAMRILPDSYLANYTEEIDGRTWTGAEIVERVAIEQSLNPRLLLALLEYESQWLSRSELSDQAALYPLGYLDEPDWVVGLYRQLDWAGKMLQTGYYGWRLRGLNAALLADGGRVALDPSLNAGTAAVQVILARTRIYDEYVIASGHTGLFATYVSMFGDPFLYAVEPIIPPNLTQPEISFPWLSSETWYYTGGPHGGWGAQSPWAALDFVSRQEIRGCTIDTAWARAVADGVIAVSAYGLVILDLDGDGNPGTGWTIFYLHLSSQDRQVTAGDWVQQGDPIGHPSCEGGFSTATHLHIARRYNGEWISADCTNCIGGVYHPPLVFSGWTAYSFGSEYDGSLVRGDEYREACACRADFNTFNGWD